MRRPYSISYRNKLFLDVFFVDKPVNAQKKSVIPIILCNFGLLSREELEAGRRYLRRSFGKDVRVEVVIKAFLPQTKKPAEVRMGKGKGKISFWVVPIRAGQVIYKLHGFVLFSKIKSTLQQLSLKFSKNMWSLDAAFFQGSAYKICRKELQIISDINK